MTLVVGINGQSSPVVATSGAFSGAVTVGTLNGIAYLTGTANPALGAGLAAAVGTMYTRTGFAQVWQKTGAGDTAWTRIASTPVAISPTALSGDVATWAPTGHEDADVIRIDPNGASRIISAFGSAATVYPWREITLVNLATTGAHTVVLRMDDGGTGTAALRFFCPNGVNLTIPSYGSRTCIYDPTSSRWRPVGPVA